MNGETMVSITCDDDNRALVLPLSMALETMYIEIDGEDGSGYMNGKGCLYELCQDGSGHFIAHKIASGYLPLDAMKYRSENGRAEITAEQVAQTKARRAFGMEPTDSFWINGKQFYATEIHIDLEYSTKAREDMERVAKELHNIRKNMQKRGNV